MTDTGNPRQQATFEEQIERIKLIVTSLEAGNLSLDESLATYEEGVRLIDQARHVISEAELKISEMAATSYSTDSDG